MSDNRPAPARRRQRLPKAWLSGSAIAAALSLLAAGVTEPARAVPETGIPMERTPSGHLLLPVTIGEAGPFAFILDTGASHTAIAAPVAESLGFRSQLAETGDVQALTTRFLAERFALNDFVVARQSPVDLVSVIIPVDPDSPVPVAGLVGADAIAAPRYAMDFAQATLTLDAPPVQRIDGRIDPVGLLVAEAGMLRANRPVRVMIDSGSSRTIVNQALRHRLADQHMRLHTMVGGVDGRLQEEAGLVQIRRFRLGGLCVSGLQVLQSDLDIFRHMGWQDEPAMVIGMDVLQFTRIAVDRDTGTVQIDAAVDEFDCETAG